MNYGANHQNMQLQNTARIKSVGNFAKLELRRQALTSLTFM